MSIEHAILGFLNYESQSGYDLKKIFDLSVSHFWPVAQSQIYKALAEMESMGWLTVETIPQESRPPRKVYSITEAGRAELMRWLTDPQPMPESRLSWLVQVFFAGQAGEETALAVLEHQLSLQRTRLNNFSNIAPENKENMQSGSAQDRFFWLLTVDYGLAQVIAQVRWLESAIAAIREGQYRLPTLQS